jgi:hypothetical protein
VGEGGAPAVVITKSRPNGAAPGSLTIEISTVGAALRWVTPSVAIRRQISAGSTARRHTLVPPIADSPQVVHQPLQWNIGSVHR